MMSKSVSFFFLLRRSCIFTRQLTLPYFFLPHLVLRRYAEDFGFDFNENMYSIANALDPDFDDDCQPHVFKILGTSVDDVSAQPHVLSPPLMDSLLNFVPDSMTMENFWLKYSLLRDGADLYTLKQYVKATPYTILAVRSKQLTSKHCMQLFVYWLILFYLPVSRGTD